GWNENMRGAVQVRNREKSSRRPKRWRFSMNDEPILLRAENVTKIYHSKPAVNDVSFETAKGQVTAILGPSGSGKSTFLRSLALLEPIDSGKIHFEGKLVGQRERRGRLVPASERQLAEDR